jgi:hypothetical protein
MGISVDETGCDPAPKQRQEGGFSGSILGSGGLFWVDPQVKLLKKRHFQPLFSATFFSHFFYQL